MSPLPENPQELKKLCISLYQKIDYLERDVSHLESKLRLSAYGRFGTSSESLLHPNMKLLFEENSESKEEEKSTDQKITIKAHERTITRKPIPDDLPREEVLVDDLEKTCPCCQSQDFKLVEKQVSEKLHYQPAKIIVRRFIRPIYSCTNCETMRFTPMPLHPIPKCSVTSETIAQIAVSKYVDSLPLYRQEQIFLRQGVEISRDKMARWLIQISKSLEPILDLLRKKLLAQDIVQMDETTVQVLKEKGRVPTAKSYMIVQARGSPNLDSIVTFHYNPSRAKIVMEELLIGFKGVLLTDGLEVYGSLCEKNSDIVHAGCWSHSRRKFVEAHKAIKPSKRKDSIANKFILLIDELFKIERVAKDFSNADRLKLRKEKSKPVTEDIENLLNENLQSFPKKSPTGMALTYLVNQWAKLTKFLTDGKIPLHNNFTENMIRPFTVGRKNWLFSDQPEGAKASAIIYSLLVTAQVNGLNPYNYLCGALKEVAKVKPDFEKVLPLNVQ